MVTFISRKSLKLHPDSWRDCNIIILKFAIIKYGSIKITNKWLANINASFKSVRIKLQYFSLWFSAKRWSFHIFHLNNLLVVMFMSCEDGSIPAQVIRLRSTVLKFWLSYYASDVVCSSSACEYFCVTVSQISAFPSNSAFPLKFLAF